MSLNITQTPTSSSLSQSPIVFVVKEDSPLTTVSGFQYLMDLYYWEGAPSQSGSVDYTLVKYPNQVGSGIFDVSRILNSTFTDLTIQKSSNVKYYKGEFYWQYWDGSQFVSSSKVASDIYTSLDGYSIFQEAISQPLSKKSPYFPILTDGPGYQQALEENWGTMGLYVGPKLENVLQADKLVYTAYIGNTATEIVDVFVSPSSTTTTMIKQFSIGPAQQSFPLTLPFDRYTIQPFSQTTPIGRGLEFNLICDRKFPNIRIVWKNRYGQFDYFNFNMASKQSFSTIRRTYQPQLGSWQSNSFKYQPFDSSVANYISDSTQSMRVNTDWIDEEYNEIFKQLLVSDEIYWVYGEENVGSTSPWSFGYNNGYGGEPVANLRPVIIQTDTLEFKTGVNDKLIQYTFDFNWGQQYKLLI